MCQDFNYFSAFLHHFVLAKLATSSTGVLLTFEVLLVDTWMNVDIYKTHSLKAPFAVRFCNSFSYTLLPYSFENPLWPSVCDTWHQRGLLWVQGSAGSSFMGWFCRYTHVLHCEGLSNVHLQLKCLLVQFIKIWKFLSDRDIT